VSAERLTRVELWLTRGSAVATHVVLDKRQAGWWVTSPVVYRANQPAVASIVAVLAEIEIVDEIVEGAARQYWVDDEHGLMVKARGAGGLHSQFVVGRSMADKTYVRAVGDERVVTVRGRCRPIFDKTLDQLRDPVITQLPATTIERVRYDNSHGVLELVADPLHTEGFVAAGTPIPNYHSERAAQQVRVVAGLRAEGFVDAPVDPDETGLFGDDTPRATVFTAGEGEPVEVWIGNRTQDHRLHVRTSDGDQIYLISAHLETSLVPRRSHLQLSPKMMQQLRARPQTTSGAAPTGSPEHDHRHPRAVASQVPIEMMTALRGLARAQREQP